MMSNHGGIGRPIKLAAACLVLWITILAAIPPETAWACSCIGPSDAEAERNKSQLVFSGKLMSRSTTAKLPEESYEALYFDAAQIWKGPQQKRITVYHTGGSCAFPFQEGEEYLVYAQGSPDAPITHMCTRTTGVREASNDIQALGNPLFDMTVTPGSTGPQPKSVSAWYIAMAAILFVLLGILGVSLLRKKRS